MADQYDVSKAERRILEENAKRRLALRQEYLKQITNPHRHASGEGGTVFDAGIQRFMSMRCTEYDHFKPTPRSARYGILILVIPLVSYTWLLKSSRDSQEHKYRTGQVSYKDRNFKFI